jgi:hypothetical protein
VLALQWLAFIMSMTTTLRERLTTAQHATLVEYAKVRYDLIENLGNSALNVDAIKRITNKLAELGVTLSQRDSIVGVRTHVGNASAMFEWDHWKQELHFFRERGEGVQV